MELSLYIPKVVIAGFWFAVLYLAVKVFFECAVWPIFWPRERDNDKTPHITADDMDREFENLKHGLERCL